MTIQSPSGMPSNDALKRVAESFSATAKKLREDPRFVEMMAKVEAVQPLVHAAAQERLEHEEGLEEAAVEAWWAFTALAEAKTIGEQSYAFMRLSDAMSDLASWLPGYDADTGRLPADDD
jgi:hypothetical protein